MAANIDVFSLPSALMQIDAVLPSQYFGSPSRQAPEMRLMIAVLHDALDCVTKQRVATNAQGRRLFDETMQWLLADDADWPYSFASICGVLDLEVDAVRESLRLAPERVPDATSCATALAV